MKIKKNKLYVYVGEGGGEGEIHQLMYKGDCCVTWGRTGFSFLGTVEEFANNFRELEEMGV